MPTVAQTKIAFCCPPANDVEEWQATYSEGTSPRPAVAWGFHDVRKDFAAMVPHESGVAVRADSLPGFLALERVV